MVEEHGGRAFLILNHDLVCKALRQVGPGRVWQFQRLPVLLNLLCNAKRAHTLERLGARCGLPERELKASLEAYNATARGERADAFGKSPAMLADLSKGPWYALDLSFACRLFPCPTISLGGLRVCETSGRVLDDNGVAIAGLYSAGRNAVGVASNLYVSGLSLADCIYSGRRAAAHMATTVTQQAQ